MVKQFLSCDWGTSSFRMRLISQPDLSVVAEIQDNKGIAVVYNEWQQSGLPETERIDFYKRILRAQIERLDVRPLPGTPLVISGMASSSIGIREVPYAEIPARVDGSGLHLLTITATDDFPTEIYMISGLKSRDDIMRGEETILAGCGIPDDTEERLFILPGTHSKHIVVQHSLIKSCKTFMTGEIFDLLVNKSILSKSIERGDESTGADDLFIKGVNESVSSNLLNSIFHIRTSDLFGQTNKRENYHYLSGLLIGEELKNINRLEYDSVTLVSTGFLCGLYKNALFALGFADKFRQLDADAALIKGQLSIFNRYKT
jgi:2-dehydro-3-deoxygalactonokinase